MAKRKYTRRSGTRRYRRRQTTTTCTTRKRKYTKRRRGTRKLSQYNKFVKQFILAEADGVRNSKENMYAAAAEWNARGCKTNQNQAPCRKYD